MALAIFDIDGTIVDSQEGILEAQRMAFAAVGLSPPSRQRSLSVVGLSLQEAFSVLVGADGPTAALAQAYREAWASLRARGVDDDPLFAGAQDALLTLKRSGFLVGVATGKSRRGVTHLIEKYGWRDLFDTVQTADDARSKPAPDMILQALAETATPAEEAFMIGDTTFDMMMAVASGAAAIGVTWGYHTADALKAAGARTLVDDFAALLAYLPRPRAGEEGEGRL